MLASIYGCIDMNWSKAGRSCKNEDIDATIDYLLIGIKAVELSITYIYSLWDVFLKSCKATCEAILKKISDGPKLCSLFRCKIILYGAASTREIKILFIQAIPAAIALALVYLS